jgi:hypothetical protein
LHLSTHFRCRLGRPFKAPSVISFWSFSNVVHWLCAAYTREPTHLCIEIIKVR